MIKAGAILSVDFDGTIVEHAYPEIGDPLPGALETLRELAALGYRLVLNTCREDTRRRQYLTEAVRWLESHGVEFVSHNENRLEDDFRQEGCPLRRKIYAHMYIDDANLGGFPGWHVVRQVFGLPPLTRRDTSEAGDPGLDSGNPGPLEGTSSSGCEAPQGCP